MFLGMFADGKSVVPPVLVVLITLCGADVYRSAAVHKVVDADTYLCRQTEQWRFGCIFCCAIKGSISSDT